MTRFHERVLFLAAVFVSPLWLAAPTQAGCNCQGAAASGSTSSAYTYVDGSQWGDAYGLGSNDGDGMTEGPVTLDAGMALPMSPVPPPGTLGQTYQLPSRPVPVKKHPRTGMVDVSVVGAREVIVHDTNAMRTEDALEGFRDANDPNLWHFSSEPLYPGLPHIYRIEASFDGPSGQTTQERYIRLIRGRIVTLTF